MKTNRVKLHFHWATVVCLCHPELEEKLTLALSVKSAPNKKILQFHKTIFLFHLKKMFL